MAKRFYSAKEAAALSLAFSTDSLVTLIRSMCHLYQIVTCLLISHLVVIVAPLLLLRSPWSLSRMSMNRLSRCWRSGRGSGRLTLHEAPRLHFPQGPTPQPVPPDPIPPLHRAPNCCWTCLGAVLIPCMASTCLLAGWEKIRQGMCQCMLKLYMLPLLRRAEVTSLEHAHSPKPCSCTLPNPH